jgi:serine/threonine protein kinase
VHASGHIHCDIKPGNILISDAKGIVLADFGVAEAAERLNGAAVPGKPSGGFHKSRIVGTLQYMAPEVLLGRYHQKVRDAILHVALACPCCDDAHHGLLLLCYGSLIQTVLQGAARECEALHP